MDDTRPIGLDVVKNVTSEWQPVGKSIREIFEQKNSGNIFVEEGAIPLLGV